MRVYRAEALVLRRVQIGETDKSVTFLTRSHGKVRAIAKGARRPTSRIAGGTELFTHCKVLLAVGRNLDVLTQCEVLNPFLNLRTHLDRFAAASYVVELADSMVEERMPVPVLFELLLDALRSLDAGRPAHLAVRAFELRAASEQGYEPSLSRCVRCHVELSPEGRVGFSAALGGAVCQKCIPQVGDAEAVAPGVVLLARQLLCGVSAPELELACMRGHAAVLGRLMRRYIETRTERKVKAAEFMDALSLAEL
ncbi:MAG: DNA repair protein RecO [Armatimonadota bacterium]